MSTIGIMQPYFFPYLGYYQLMHKVDKFIIYDEAKYVKQSWINRNRILVNGNDSYITIPLRKDSDHFHINQRRLAESWSKDRIKLLNRIKENYTKAPFYKNVFPLIEYILMDNHTNLFDFLFASLLAVRDYLTIKTPIVAFSTLSIDNKLKGEELVIAICKSCSAVEYINPIGGVTLYSKETFFHNNIKLSFLRMSDIQYTQFNHPFVASLSIIDVLMFNSLTDIMSMLKLFTIE